MTCATKPRAVTSDTTEVLAIIDRMAADLQALRCRIAGGDEQESSADLRNVDAEDQPADDFAEWNLISVRAAHERFNVPEDTIRFWCRHEDCGVQSGGPWSRWSVSVPRVQRFLAAK